MPRRYLRTHVRNFKRYSHICQHCKTGFSSSRPDSVYHAPKCREAARRLRLLQEQFDREREEARAAEVARQVAEDRRREEEEAKAAEAAKLVEVCRKKLPAKAKKTKAKKSKAKKSGQRQRRTASTRSER